MSLACRYLEKSVNPTLAVGPATGCDEVARSKRERRFARVVWISVLPVVLFPVALVGLPGLL